MRTMALVGVAWLGCVESIGGGGLDAGARVDRDDSARREVGQAVPFDASAADADGDAATPDATPQVGGRLDGPADASADAADGALDCGELYATADVLDVRFEAYRRDGLWEDARACCELRGGHLATITDAEQNAAVVALHLATWTEGLTRGPWIGIQRTSECCAYTWITGEPVEYAPWSGAETLIESEGMRCGMFSLYPDEPDRWQTAPCVYWRTASFVCEAPRD